MKYRICSKANCEGNGTIHYKDEYCWLCGAKTIDIDTPMCKNCGVEMSRSDHFCTKCGTKKETA
jgi:predicted amidophosphoribosyltransferase